MKHPVQPARSAPDILVGQTLTEETQTTKDEEELGETQLRQLYDEEEIDRFLHVFSDVSAIHGNGPRSKW